MALTTLLYVYVFGGVTFIPLLLAAILIPAWLLLPTTSIEDAQSRRTSIVRDGTADGDSTAESDEQETDLSGEGAASATFAVLRTYNFQAATTALNARSVGQAAGRDAAVDGSNETSESVYQSMYRSVFDRSKNHSNPMLERDEESSDPIQAIKRKPVSVSVFYIILRHGHLMLYDSVAQMEVRHVIRLAHYDISLSEGDPHEVLIDADLFIKRTAIVLTPKPSSTAKLMQPATKPFYLFSTSCSDKEDFYHALLTSRSPPPSPQTIAPADAIKLQSALHSTSLSSEMRAMNALISRVFLALYRTDDLENAIRSKIERKMSRVPKPSFIASLVLNSIDLGDSAPIFSNPKLKDMNISGDTTIELDVKYSGGLKIVISAQAKIDLGSRFKTRTVDLVLATSLQRLQGHMSVRIKPPPSNRIWFCFEGAPDMEIKVEPVVSQRQITYAFILRAIEERIRAVVAETLVKPNWDDAPFSDTTSQYLRGGIWKDEKLEASVTPDNVSMRSGSESLETPKRHSGSTLVTTSDDHSDDHERISRAATLASSLAWQGSTSIKRRSVTSLSSANEKASSSPPLDPPPFPRGLRSPSLTSPTPSLPSLSTEGATIVPNKSQDAAAQPRGWRIRAGQQIPSKRDAVEAVREMRDRAFMHINNEQINDESSASRLSGSTLPMAIKDRLGHTRTPSDLSSSPTTDDGFGPGSLSRSDTAQTNSSTQSRAQQQRKSILAATAAATNAARNWSWNTIANRGRAASTNTESQTNSLTKGEPMGRGQPLPPPGVPLPGPQKSIWASAGLPNVKRKPVATLPSRPAQARRASSGTLPSEEGQFEDAVREDAERKDDKLQLRPVDDEFGPWSENSGSKDLPTNSSMAELASTEIGDDEPDLSSIVSESAFPDQITASIPVDLSDLHGGAVEHDIVNQHIPDLSTVDYAEPTSSTDADKMMFEGEGSDREEEIEGDPRHQNEGTTMKGVPATSTNEEKHNVAQGTVSASDMHKSSQDNLHIDPATMISSALPAEDEEIPVRMTDVVNDFEDEQHYKNHT